MFSRFVTLWRWPFLSNAFEKGIIRTRESIGNQRPVYNE